MTRRLASAFALVVLAATASTLPACRKVTGDAGYAAEASDSLDTSAHEGAILSVATDDVPTAFGGPLGADALAAAAAANAGKHLVPAGCVAATASGAKVTYVYDDCTGPRGLLHVTGTVDVTFDTGGGGVQATATSTGLNVNGATLDLDAVGVFDVVAGGKRLVVTSHSTGTGPRGHDVAHDGSYTFTWDGTCHTLDGAWSTTSAGLKWSTTVAGFKRCLAACPAAGGTITHTGGVSGVTVTITFDGSASAKWSTSRGKSGTVMLFCTP